MNTSLTIHVRDVPKPVLKLSLIHNLKFYRSQEVTLTRLSYDIDNLVNFWQRVVQHILSVNARFQKYVRNVQCVSILSGGCY
jgi:hypothetical protein